jgi:HAD superfamily hydrolase (TIGR01459 family)
VWRRALTQMREVKEDEPTTMHTQIVSHVAPILANYDVLLCDIWGVVHDGRVAIPENCAALTRFRERGGTVVLVSNAPVPPDAVARILADKTVPRAAWDRIVSSGGLAIEHLLSHGYQRVHRLGPPGRDAAFFAALPPDVPLADADAIACSGLFNDHTETAEMYRERLQAPAARGVPMVCANPDLVVHVGHDLLPCAGALGIVYEDLGGKVFWTGKPHAIAYGTALQLATELRGGETLKSRILAVGDAVRTDLAAAAGAGVDAFFVASGIHRDAILDNGRIVPERMQSEFEAGGYGAKYAALGLVW